MTTTLEPARLGWLGFDATLEHISLLDLFLGNTIFSAYGTQLATVLTETLYTSAGPIAVFRFLLADVRQLLIYRTI